MGGNKTTQSPLRVEIWPQTCCKEPSFRERLHFLQMCPQVASSTVLFPWQWLPCCYSFSMATTGKLTRGGKTEGTLVTKTLLSLKTKKKQKKRSDNKRNLMRNYGKITQAQDRHKAASAALMTQKHKLWTEDQCPLISLLLHTNATAAHTKLTFNPHTAKDYFTDITLHSFLS